MAPSAAGERMNRLAMSKPMHDADEMVMRRPKRLPRKPAGSAKRTKKQPEMSCQPACIAIRQAYIFGGVQGQEGFNAGIGQKPEEDGEQDAHSAFILIVHQFAQAGEHVRLFFALFIFASVP